MRVVEQQIATSTHQNAVMFLEDYLSQVGFGLPDDTRRNPLLAFSVFYLDENGDRLSGHEINNMLDEHIDELLSEQMEIHENFDQSVIGYSSGNDDNFLTSSFDLNLMAEADLDIQPIELSTDTRAIGQRLNLMGIELIVGVSYPVDLIERRLRELRKLFTWLIPVFALLSGIATWVVVGHVLEPIRQLTRDANRINERRVNRRLVEPEADNEFRSLAKTLNAMLGRIEQAQKSQRQFVSDASHELRSPITATKLLLEVTGNSEDDWRKSHYALTHENERLLRLVNDLLYLAQMDESDSCWLMVDVDLEELLFAESGRPRKNVVELEVTTAVRIRADKMQISTVIGNLLDNADRYAQSRIKLGLYSSDKYSSIKVEDDGPGIPDNKKKIIFERFSRVEGSRVRKSSQASTLTSSGAGLGLAIAVEIVSRYNGTISVSDSALGGACFTVSLPKDAEWGHTPEFRIAKS